MYNIKKSWLRNNEKNYPYWFWLIDMHGTLFANNYQKGSFGGPFFEDALGPLRFLTQHKKAKLILWTSSYGHVIDAARADLKDKGIIFDFVNENPLIPNDELCDFSKKPYFDVLIDDKAAGFDAEFDWKKIEYVLADLFEDYHVRK